MYHKTLGTISYDVFKFNVHETRHAFDIQNVSSYPFVNVTAASFTFP